MMKILPILMLLLGIGAGVGAGVVLKPDEADMANSSAMEGVPDHEPELDQEEAGGHGADDDPTSPEYIELNNQFVVPVVSGDMVEALVVLSLGVEVDAASTEDVYRREPKLRDAFLQVLFDHANMGGFRGRFTDGNNMDVLRLSLTEAAQSVVGKAVKGVVITGIARQDI